MCAGNACNVLSGAVTPERRPSSFTSGSTFRLPSFLPRRVAKISCSECRSTKNGERCRRSSNENGILRCLRPLPATVNSRLSGSQSAALRLNTSSLLAHPHHCLLQFLPCWGSVRSHLKLCLYHSRVAGETFERYCRSRINCSKRGSMFSPSEYSIVGVKSRIWLNGRDGQI